jgi:hypothetical protein
LAAVLASAACVDNTGFGIDLTLMFADSVSDAAVAGVTSFSIRVSGDETGEYPVTLDRAANRTERLVYRPKLTSRMLSLDVQALGATALIAEGLQASVALLPDHTTPVDITLTAPIMPDASTGDMEIPVDDASMPPLGSDAAPPSDDDMATRPPSTCGTASVTGGLCEGFEGTLHSAWTIHSTNGTVSYDTTRAYRGNSSLHLHGNAVTSGTTVDVRISESQTFSPPPNNVYARAYFYLLATPSNNAQLFSAVELPSPYLGEALLATATDTFSTGDSVSGGAYTNSTTAVPLNQWFCLEWQVHIETDSTGYMKVAYGSVPTQIAALDVDEPTSPPGGLGAFSAGFEVYNPSANSPVFDVWMDELIVNVLPVTCTE